MAEIVLTYKELVDSMNMYKGFTHRVFEYMNEKISPYLKCNLIINSYGDCNYGSFKKPNLIEINLGSILNNHKDMSDDYIRFFICLAVSHELFHANQQCSMMRYGADPLYAERMEAQAELMARTFLVSNAAEIGYMFNCTVPMDIIHNQTLPDMPYSHINENVKEWLINVLVDSWFKNTKMTDSMRLVFNNPSEEYRSIFIKFDSLEPICVKVNGVYVVESIQIVADTIYNNYRSQRAVLHFQYNTHVDIVPSDIGPVAILCCTSTSRPILYPIVDAD